MKMYEYRIPNSIHKIKMDQIPNTIQVYDEITIQIIIKKGLKKVIPSIVYS